MLDEKVISSAHGGIFAVMELLLLFLPLRGSMGTQLISVKPYRPAITASQSGCPLLARLAQSDNI